MSDVGSSMGAAGWQAWSDRAIYRAIARLAREDRAWEILRRNNAYHAAFRQRLARKPTSDPAAWGLVVFCDPWA